VRGHSSRQETECSFPKLKIRFEDADALTRSIFRGTRTVKIGTHCGESSADELTPRFGRLANERAAHREAFVYRLLGVLDVPTLLARPARITYVDSSSSAKRRVVTRDALLVEDD